MYPRGETEDYTVNITVSTAKSLLLQTDKTVEKVSELNSEITVFPNPVSDRVYYLNLPDGTIFPAVLEMFSINGQKVLQIELNDCCNTIKTDGLINGLYILSVQYNGKVQKLKLQINR